MQGQFPSEEEMVDYAELVRAREPLVNNVIGFVGGVSIPVQCGENADEQNAYYSGYYHDTMINNVFAFSPTGKILHACVNFPGSWHDSSVCWSLCEVVVDRANGHAFCVDKGFPRGGDMNDKFVGPLSRRGKQRLAPQVRDYLITMHEVYNLCGNQPNGECVHYRVLLHD